MKIRKLPWTAGVLSLLLMVGCTAPMIYVPREKPLQEGAPLEAAFDMPEDLAPRERAAMELARRGWTHLKRKQPTEAVRALEKAVNLYPTGGRIYYYLAEAWFMKGDLQKAGNFNRLAELYSDRDPQWQQRIARQQERIGR